MEDNNLVKKSIFKQEKQRIIYEFVIEERQNSYRFGTHTYEAKINKNTEKIPNSEVDIFMCDLELPMLEVKDEFYIEELNKTVKINKRIRTSKENVCYYVSPEIIEDEISEQSKEKANQLQHEYCSLEEEKLKLMAENTDLRKFKNKVISSFWYKLIK